MFLSLMFCQKVRLHWLEIAWPLTKTGKFRLPAKSVTNRKSEFYKSRSFKCWWKRSLRCPRNFVLLPLRNQIGDIFVIWHTTLWIEKSFRNLILPNQIWIEVTLFRLIPFGAKSIWKRWFWALVPNNRKIENTIQIWIDLKKLRVC